MESYRRTSCWAVTQCYSTCMAALGVTGTPSHRIKSEKAACGKKTGSRCKRPVWPGGLDERNMKYSLNTGKH